MSNKDIIAKIVDFSNRLENPTNQEIVQCIFSSIPPNTQIVKVFIVLVGAMEEIYLTKYPNNADKFIQGMQLFICHIFEQS